jgi:hypothetical protein
MFHQLIPNENFRACLIYEPQGPFKSVKSDPETIVDFNIYPYVVKKEYSNIYCEKCNKLNDDTAFELGFHPPFLLDKKIVSNKSTCFASTIDNFMIVNDVFYKCVKDNKINGCEFKKIGASGWHVMSITCRVKFKFETHEPGCQFCGRLGPRKRRPGCIDEIEHPNDSNTFFTLNDPLNMDTDWSRDVLMTASVAHALAKAGIYGGFCKRLLTTDERVKRDLAFESNKTIKFDVIIKLNGKTSIKSSEPPTIKNIKLKKSGKKISKESIGSTEEYISRKFPEDYRSFLLDKNGGIPSPNRYGDDEYEIDRFYSLQELPQAWEEFQRELKEAMDLADTIAEDTLLPIAPDTSGNTFCLAIAGPNTGRIALFNHEENDYNFVEDSFTAFFNSLKKASVEEE